MQIVSLYNEVELMKELGDSTVSLIHKTSSIQPIKKLITIHDMIQVNLTVSEIFKDHKDAPIWDKSALKEMNLLRAEILVYHHLEFTPFSALQKYNNDIIRFFNVMELREQNLKKPIGVQ
jgi:hypothetical protein